MIPSRVRWLLCLLALSGACAELSAPDLPEEVATRSDALGTSLVNKRNYPTRMSLPSPLPAGGGPLTGNVTLVPVYVSCSAAGGATISPAPTFISKVRGFYNHLIGSTHLKWLRQEYQFGPVTLATADNTLPFGDCSDVTETKIVAMLRAKFPANTNSMFAVHFPPTARWNGGTSTCPPAGCAWNNTSGGYHYYAMPDYDSCSGCKPSPSSIGDGSAFDADTLKESHEIVEQLTNPSGTAGWRNRTDRGACGQLVGNACTPSSAYPSCAEFCKTPQCGALNANCVVGLNGCTASHCVGGKSDGVRVEAYLGTQVSDPCGLWPERIGTPGTTSAPASYLVQDQWSNNANQCKVAGPGAPGDSVLGGTSDIILAANGVSLAYPPFGTRGSMAALAQAAVGGASSFPTLETQGWPLAGDFDGDGLGDFALVGGSGSTIPTAFASATTSGQFNWQNKSVASFNVATAIANQLTNAPLPPVSGDFNGDGYSDIAMVGGINGIGGSRWTSIAVAFSNAGQAAAFSGSNLADGGFNSHIAGSTSRPKVLAGDFNGDGLSDLALVGLTSGSGAQLQGLPHIVVALSQLNANVCGAVAESCTVSGACTSTLCVNGFVAPMTTATTPFAVKTVTLTCVGAACTSGSTFNLWAAMGAMRAVAGDFDGNGIADIALSGAFNSASIPVAFGAGTPGKLTGFSVSNSGSSGNATFAANAGTVGTELHAGDFDGDGLTDLALTGGIGTTGVQIGYSQSTFGVGTFQWSNVTSGMSTFASAARQPGVIATSASVGYAFTRPSGCGLFSAYQALTPGQSFPSCDSRFSLQLNNGKLSFMRGTTTLWSTATTTGALALLQGDGNFVLYDQSYNALWSTGSSNKVGAYLEVQNDGNLVLYGPGPHTTVLWNSGMGGIGPTPAPACGQLAGGQGLTGTQTLWQAGCTPNTYFLTLQTDGNLVLYRNTVPLTALWHTATNGTAGWEAIMQTDGNLVVYDPWRALWASGTSGNPGAVLNVTTDGHVTINSAGGSQLWRRP